MPIATAARSVPFGAVTAFRFVNAFDTLLAALVNWNKARQTRIALSSLSDDQLADIGLMRVERF